MIGNDIVGANEPSPPPPEHAVRWLSRRFDKRARVLSAIDLANYTDETPQFWHEDMDGAYREGFEAGFDYCIERFDEMYRKRGFTRVREIANILWRWSDTVLRRWRYYGQGMYKNPESDRPQPIHTHESWSEIRERILRRDKCCVRCGDVVKLEVDHIVEVQDGGLPTDDNLRALCAVCHKGKGLWSS